MGATGWDYFVPYEANISTALQRLREAVFARGDYESDEGLTEEMRRSMVESGPRLFERIQPVLNRFRETAETKEEPVRSRYIQMVEKIKHQLLHPETVLPKSKQKRKPKTIAVLLKRQADGGTHSILDILRISSLPEPYTISPFPREKLTEFFESETPSHSKIQEVYESGSLEDFVGESWQGIYIIAFLDDSPCEIFFAGSSGD
jgi:hypothetical protein